MHATKRAGEKFAMALFLGMLVQTFDTGILAQTPQGLVAHYTFDTPGQPEHDSIGGNHGVAVVGVTQVPGLKGQAASFSNGWIDLPPSPDFNLLGGDFTLSVFVNVTPGTDNRNWFTKATASTHEYGLGGGAPVNNGKVGIAFAGGPGGGAVSVSQPFDGQWHHIAGIKRGNQAEIWVDGILEETGALNVSVVTDIGQFAIGRDGACCQFFNGLMDEAKIWSKALSASEIAAEIHRGSVISSWTTTTPLPQGCPGAGAVSHGSHLIVLCGSPSGNSTYVGEVDGSGNVLSWSPTLALPSTVHPSELTRIGKYLIVPFPGNSYVGRLAVDGSIISWTPNAGTVSPAINGRGVTSDGNRVYSIGGGLAGSVYADVEMATLQPNGVLSAWQYLIPLPVPIHDPQTTVVGNYLYVFGGESAGGGLGVSSDVRRAPILLDGTIGPWEFVGLLKDARPHAGHLRFGGTIHVVAGGVHGYMTASVESVLESALGNTSQHTYSQSLPTILNEFGTAVVGSFGYVIGGNNQHFGGGALNTVHVASLGLESTLWIGLKNSDDQGTQFDLRTEALVNNRLVSAGETRCITSVTRNPNLATEVTVPFSPVSGALPNSGDLFSFRILTRIGTNPDGTKCSGPGGNHNNAVGLRLYFDSITRPSRLSGQTMPDLAGEFFLHALGGNLFLDSYASMMGTAKFKDSSSINFANGNPWKEIGTWTMTLP